MFTKSRTNEPDQAKQEDKAGAGQPQVASNQAAPGGRAAPAPKQRPKAPPSVLSTDLTVRGNLKTTGDIQIEGQVEGDIRAHLLTIGENATVKGEVVADDVIINGRILGRVRGLKVRLAATARVEGDIIHKTIAIESGAHFEGSVQRQDDPLTGAPQKGGGAPQQSQQQTAAKQQG